MKLTKAQRRTLQSVADDAVLMMFDVWGGYEWYEQGKRLPARRRPGWFQPLPIAKLHAADLIQLGEVERVASGTQARRYRITPAGRSALEE